MPSTSCAACSHPAVEEIDLRLSQGITVRAIAEAYGLNAQGMGHHRMHYVPRAWWRLRRRELSRGARDPGKVPVDGWVPGQPLPAASAPASLRVATQLREVPPTPGVQPPHEKLPGEPGTAMGTMPMPQLGEEDEKIADVVDGVEAMRRNRRTALGMLGVAGRYVLLLDNTAKRIERQMLNNPDEVPSPAEIAALCMAAAKLARTGMENLRDGYDLLRARAKDKSDQVGPAPGSIDPKTVEERMRRIERTRRLLVMGGAPVVLDPDVCPTPAQRTVVVEAKPPQPPPGPLDAPPDAK